MKKENTRLQVTVSPVHLALLSKWGAFHGKTPTEFAGWLIARACEDNVGLINNLDKTRIELESND